MTTRKFLGIGAVAVALTGASFVGTAGANMVADPAGQIGLFRGLIGLISDMAGVAKDPTASGVAAVFGVEDHLGEGTRAITFFEETLKDVENPAIKRAVHIKLSELYGNTGETDKAMEQLRILITAEPED